MKRRRWERGCRLAMHETASESRQFLRGLAGAPDRAEQIQMEQLLTELTRFVLAYTERRL